MTNQDKVRLSVSSLIAQDLLLAEGGIVFRPEGGISFRRLGVICASVSEASVDEARDPDPSEGDVYRAVTRLRNAEIDSIAQT